ncbi:MAG TPA: sodium:calcium antiporter, partial [Phycisphaerae bacterium]|nr:sodium:calcium antiporter [Phycisphaerae bacterium]
LSLDGRLSRTEGLALVAGCAAYTAWAVRMGRRENQALSQDVRSEVAPERGSLAARMLLPMVLLIVGIVLLIVGARWLVESAVCIARWAGVGELVIGLTIVAGGTSLPELATSVMAAWRGERDIAVGNIVGSNIFNILMVLGGSAVLASNGMTVATAALWFDIPIMIVVAVSCLPIFMTGGSISRWEGAFFFLYYLLYASFLVVYGGPFRGMTAGHAVLMGFAAPLLLATLLVLLRHRLGRKAAAGASQVAKTQAAGTGPRDEE